MSFFVHVAMHLEKLFAVKLIMQLGQWSNWRRCCGICCSSCLHHGTTATIFRAQMMLLQQTAPSETAAVVLEPAGL